MATVDTTKLTQHHLIAGINWIAFMSDQTRWNITSSEVSLILDIDEAQYCMLKNRAELGLEITLNEGTVERLCFLISISRLLKKLAPTEPRNLEFELFNTPNSNPLFKGYSIKGYLIKNRNVSAFYDIRQYLSMHMPA